MTQYRHTLIVLLVEDEVADAHLVRMAFQEGGLPIDLHHVTDGVEALSYLEGRSPYQGKPRPDLILLDLNMPRMDGRAFLAKVKASQDLRRIPVVVLTTSDAESDIVASYDCGAAGFVVKPIDLDEFVARLHELEKYWSDVVRIPSR